jgi:hypothetical protein
MPVGLSDLGKVSYMHHTVSRATSAASSPGSHRTELLAAGTALTVAALSAVVAAPSSAVVAEPASVTPTGGTVIAWGHDGDGQASPPADLTGVVDVAGGQSHSLALKDDGTVVGWGYNSGGQAEPPADLTDAVEVEAGSYFSVALRENGTVEAWGIDWDGESSPPEGLTDVVDISAYASHTLALTADGTVHSWGQGWSGETLVPEGLTDVVDIAAGGSHSLALREDGTVVGWGSDYAGAATPPEDLTDAVAVFAGSGYSFALREDGTLVSWGREVAAPPAGLSDVIDVAGGVHHWLALRADGTVVGWGEEPAGTPPADLAGVTAIAAGGSHSLAVVGDGDTEPPVLDVPGNLDVTATSADGATVDFPVTAEDDVDGAVAATCDPAPGSLLPLGGTTVTCEATDAAGNAGKATFDVTVSYDWSGFQRPLHAGATLEAGRTVPVKFSLAGESAGIADADATLWYAPVRYDGVGPLTPASTRAGAGNSFRYDAGADQYTFTWSTKGLEPGDYVLVADLGDGVERSVPVTLR